MSSAKGGAGSAVRARHQVRVRKFKVEGFKGHGAGVVQEVLTDGEEIRPGAHAADPMKEESGRVDADADEVHELFHALDLGGFG